MGDIVERLKAEAEKVSVMEAPLYYVHISCAEAREAADTIEALRAENAKLLEENDAYKMDGGSCADEVKRLRAENAALKARIDDLLDTTFEADCQRDTAKIEIEQLREALKHIQALDPAWVKYIAAALGETE